MISYTNADTGSTGTGPGDATQSASSTDAGTTALASSGTPAGTPVCCADGDSGPVKDPEALFSAGTSLRHVLMHSLAALLSAAAVFAAAILNDS